MANAQYYREKAEYCEAMAANARDQKLKSDWLKLAAVWEEMAGRDATALMARIDKALGAAP